MLVGKYSDGLPLHRQKERYARLGFDVAVSTLVDQVTWVADLLRSLWRAVIAACIGSKVMHLDATRAAGARPRCAQRQAPRHAVGLRR
jgi:hypothetical protein